MNMPNKCVKCGKLHADEAEYLLNGCDACGSRFFFYVRKESLAKVEKAVEKLTEKEVQEIEQDVRDILPKEYKKDETVVLDIEAIRVVKPGKYEIDVTNLFNQKPVVIKIGVGKYKLDLTTLMVNKRLK